MKRDVKPFLFDILENINLIESSDKISLLELKSNRLLFDATLRRLEIIGEAVKNIETPFKEKYPQVEWKKIAGLRDVLIHAYFGIQAEIIWNIIKKDVPKLREQIREILKKEGYSAPVFQ